MKFEIEDIENEGIAFKMRGFLINLRFYPTSWSWAQSIEVTKRGGRAYLYSNLESVKKALSILQTGGREAQILWTVMQLLNPLTYRVKGDRFKEYLWSASSSEILKSVWYSMLHRQYTKSLRDRTRRLTRELIRLGEVQRENKWAKKILGVEKRVLWDKVFKNSWKEGRK